MIDKSILIASDEDLIETLLFGNHRFSLQRNLSIIKASVSYITNPERFDKSLF